MSHDPKECLEQMTHILSSERRAELECRVDEALACAVREMDQMVAAEEKAHYILHILSGAMDRAVGVVTGDVPTTLN